MTVATNIVLADALATPVNHTFVPVGKDDKNVFWFNDQSITNAIGFWRISVEVKTPAPAKTGDSSSGRSYRYRIGLHEPILEVVSNATVVGIAPAPTVSYIPRSFTEFLIPERASLQNRRDLRKMTSALLADANIVTVVESLNYLV
jgi:hypothetical protein